MQDVAKNDVCSTCSSGCNQDQDKNEEETNLNMVSS